MRGQRNMIAKVPSLDPIRPRGARGPAIFLAMVAALASAGCGSSSGGGSTTRTEASVTRSAAEPKGGTAGRKPDLATIVVATDGRTSNGRLDPHYTCKGANISPPMLWGGVPSGTQEVAVVVRTLTRGHLITNWVVAGLSPSTSHLKTGSLPAAAVVGRNSSGQVGYSLCPPSGKPALVVFAVLGLPHKLGLKTGFDPHSVGALIGTPGVAWGSETAFTGAGGQVIQ